MKVQSPHNFNTCYLSDLNFDWGNAHSLSSSPRPCCLLLKHDRHALVSEILHHFSCLYCSSWRYLHGMFLQLLKDLLKCYFTVGPTFLNLIRTLIFPIPQSLFFLQWLLPSSIPLAYYLNSIFVCFSNVRFRRTSFPLCSLLYLHHLGQCLACSTYSIHCSNFKNHYYQNNLSSLSH